MSREWISVDERLPELNNEDIYEGSKFCFSDHVLVYLREAFWETGSHYVIAYLELDSYQEQPSWWNEYGTKLDDYVVAWMPFPEPPEKE